MKNKDKEVIIVEGNQDGILGVATNKKEAIKIAHKWNYGFASYSKLLEGETTQYGDDRVEVYFDYRYLNN